MALTILVTGATAGFGAAIAAASSATDIASSPPDAAPPG